LIQENLQAYQSNQVLVCDILFFPWRSRFPCLLRF
jgi:hypothetical protein